MTLGEWLPKLRERGVELWPEGDRLRFRAPKGALTAEDRAELSARRAEIVLHLRQAAAARHETAPLSFSQQSLWFLQQQAPGSSAYHVCFTAHVLSPLDVGALRSALQALLDRHAGLRTTYAVEDGAPVQRVAGAAEVAFEVHPASGASDAALRAAVAADYARPFDLERGPVLRASLHQRGPADQVLLLTVHHIAADGWSLMILVEELLKLYVESAGGAPAALPRPAVTYTDYARWQDELLRGPEGERLWSAWQRRLAGPPAPLELPADRPRPPVKSFQGGSVPVLLTPEWTERVKELARREVTTPFVVLLAAFQSFLFRLSGATDVVVGTPTFARGKAEFMRVVGDFVNSVALRGDLAAAATFRALVQQLKQTLVEALDAQELPLSLLVQRLNLARDPSRSPLFETFFTLQRFDQFKELQGLLAGGGPEDAAEVAGLRLAPFPLPQQEGQFDLSLQMLEHGGALRGVLKYNSELFEAATVAGFATGFAALVEAALRDPDRALSELPAPPASCGADGGAAVLLERLRARDVRLLLDGERLKVNAPKGALDEATRAAVAARRDELVAALRAERALADGAGPRRVPRDVPLQLSPAQERLWALERAVPGRPLDHLGAALRLRGTLDVGVLRRAVEALGARHEALRTRLDVGAGAPALAIGEVGPELATVDLGDLPADAREREALRRWSERLRTPFDLARGPLAALELYRLAPGEHLLTLTLHRLVADPATADLLAGELCGLHAALAAGRALPPAPALQLPDHAAWERERLGSGRLGREVAYWRQELAGAPSVLELPTDRPRPPAHSFRAGRLRRDLDGTLREAVARLAREHEATPFMVVLAGLQALLHRHSGQDDVVVGTHVANRDLPGLAQLAGGVGNDLALRARLAGNPTFAELLAQVRRTTLSALDHAHLPFAVLVDLVEAEPEGGRDHAPVFQVRLTLRPAAAALPAPAGLVVEPVLEGEGSGVTELDLDLELFERTDGFAAVYTYARDLFDGETVARLHGQLGRLLLSAAADPSRRAQELPLLGVEDERFLLEERNDTGLAHDRSRCVHHLLEASARARPDAIAVVDGQGSLTYRALEERANRLAQLLAQRGVKPGALVAVCVDRDADMPVAVAAVLKAGAAYVPLDPTHPAERLRYTLTDAGVACAVTLSRFAPLLAEAHAPLVLLDASQEALAALPATPPAVAVRPDDRAYVIYTSGSTGRPKGVEVEHRNVVAFLEAMRRTPGMTAEDALLAVTTLSFDIAGLELWLPLSVGARVVIASRADVLDGERLGALLAAHRITVLQATPATFRLLLEAGWAGKRDLVALCGGEALPRDLAAALLPRVAALWNMYGPTETTIWSTLARVEDPSAPITIGGPIQNTRVYVLERSGLPAPVGVPGELCVGGEGVARGYHDRPELTAEKFVAVELPGGRRERVYRTGDVARILADGRLEFLGRRDHQVKLRGYRIELGEIEAVLASHAGVSRCVVAVREDTPGDQRLAGYVVEEAGVRFDAEAARGTLRARLPEYMVPGVFTVLAALPLTPNGKIDRKALPVPEGPARTAGTPADEAHLTPLQRRVAGAWREVLRCERVGLHDNFFDLGGHSLLLVKLHAALRAELDPELKLVELFQWTTVAAQAARLSAGASSAGALRRAQARAARQTHG